MYHRRLVKKKKFILRQIVIKQVGIFSTRIDFTLKFEKSFSAAVGGYNYKYQCTSTARNPLLDLEILYNVCLLRVRSQNNNLKKEKNRIVVICSRSRSSARLYCIVELENQNRSCRFFHQNRDTIYIRIYHGIYFPV